MVCDATFHVEPSAPGLSYQVMAIHETTSMPGLYGSRSTNRGPVLDFTPELSTMYGWQFQETAANIAFLPLSRQKEKLNEAVEKTRATRKWAESDRRQEAYNDLSKNIAALLLLRDLLQI